MIDYKRILEKYRPSPEETEKLRSISDGLISRINALCAQRGLRAEAVPVGSYAKGTNLRDGDIDIFIAFDRDYPEEFINRQGLAIGHAVLENGREKYAEHPYVSGTVDGVKVDIVPCYRMEFGDRKISAVDRTLLHTKYVNDHLNEEGKDQVRLLKIFTKSIGVYGAEAKTYGFSGYLCELLIIRFGDFENTVNFFAKAKGRVLIDNDGKFTEPMVIIDPTDPDRNIASPVSLESLSRMKIACRMFVSDPDEKFFELEKKKKDVEYHDRGTAIRIYSIEKPDLTDDVLYPQVYRFRSALLKIMERHDMEAIASEIDVSDRIYVLIETRKKLSDKVVVHEGPPVDTDNAVQFVKKWSSIERSRGPYIVGERLYVDVFQEVEDVEDLVKKEIKEYSIGKNLDRFKDKIQVIKFEGFSGKLPVLDRFFSSYIFK